MTDEPEPQPAKVNIKSEADIVNPIDLHASDSEKVRQLQVLTEKNQPMIDNFLRKIDKLFGTRSNSDRKSPAKIIAKGKRPSIRKRKPWFRIEHVRDSFRCITVLKDITVLPKIAEELKKAGFQIVKVDTSKMLTPKAFGWRMVAIDLKMPNGQLVEYYLPVEEVFDFNEKTGHELFEKWRSKNLDEYSESDWIQFEIDVETSSEGNLEAWKAYLRRTGQKEHSVREVLQKTESVLSMP